MKTLTLSTHYPRTILHCIRDQKDLCAEFLSDAQISPSVINDSRARVPIESHVKLYQKIAPYINDESFGYLEHPLRFGTFAIACEYAGTAETIGRALEKISRFYSVVTDDLKLDLQIVGKEAHFSVKLRKPELDKVFFLVETFLCIGFRLSSWLAGRAIPLNFCQFSYEPVENKNEYIFLFPCEHRFAGTGPNILAFDADFLNFPVLKTASDIRSYISRAPADLLNKLVGSDSFTNRVYAVLSKKDCDDAQDAKTVASELAMTEQTLRRKLRSEGSSVQKIKDSLRLDSAVFHLTQDKYTIAEISEKLNFSTPSAFSRAFKNWTGVPPEEYRNR